MGKTKTRINLWSGPRNISTAMMYSFAQRADTVVYDEPLYAYYLNQTNADAYHPGADEVLQNMETNGSKVLSMMQGDHERPVAFFKQMTHHLHELDRSFLSDMKNIILTRDPKDMLPSFAKEIHSPVMVDVGYRAQVELMNYFENQNLPYAVLDSRRVLENPSDVLNRLCQSLQIDFDPKMLNWEAGARPEDGSWASHWYASVHKSTGFMKYKPKTEPFPDHLKPLLEESVPYYNTLLDRSL